MAGEGPGSSGGRSVDKVITENTNANEKMNGLLV